MLQKHVHYYCGCTLVPPCSCTDYRCQSITDQNEAAITGLNVALKEQGYLDVLVLRGQQELAISLGNATARPTCWADWSRDGAET